ncbi:MAG: Mur ligase family protein, partial [Proteobacteria bacterium]|nr:Mur ligase family protein [Pseudomonadota bacterium]
MHRSEVLALVSAQFKTIAVSGTHGKSTTSALIAHLLLGLGLDPSFILGANLKAHNQQGSPYQLGEGEYLVVEADESDGSFQRYYPWLAVVTNIDQDHLDFYKSMRAMEDAYLRLLQNINSEGTAVLFWDHARVRELTEKTFTSRKLSYGSFIGAEVRMIKFNQQGSSFLISIVVEHEVVDLVVPLIGRHNAYNVVGSLAVLRALGLPLAESRNILANFPGVSRRMDLYFSSHSRTIYDDFAHNPVKISSCLKGVREAFPASHITAVFQAHRYTRLQHMYTEMMSAFSSADTVIVVPVYAAGEEVPLLSTEDSADRESLEFSFT